MDADYLARIVSDCQAVQARTHEAREAMRRLSGQAPHEQPTLHAPPHEQTPHGHRD